MRSARVAQEFGSLGGVCGNVNWAPLLKYKNKKQCTDAGFYWFTEHTGVDFLASGVVHIVADGDFVFKGAMHPGYGNVKVFRHADGNCSLYAHLQNEVLWSAQHGQGERQGDPIGLVGDTGVEGVKLLHFAVYRWGTAPPSGTANALPPPYLQIEDGKHAKAHSAPDVDIISYFCNPLVYIASGKCGG